MCYEMASVRQLAKLPDSDAIIFTREWVTKQYAWLVKEYKDNDPEYVKHYDKEHWNSVPIDELCCEVHQIMWEQGWDRQQVFQFIDKLMKYEGWKLVFKFLTITTNHST